MPEVSKTVIVSFSPDQIYRLVDDVERYPEFLPWCIGSTVLSRDAHVMRAMLKVGFRGIKQSFSTETHNTPPHEITIKLIDGPFRSLDGRWRFNDLSGRGCKIEFHLSWEFSSQVMGALVGSVFGHIADTMVGAFVKRAERVYVVHRD